MRTSAGLKTSSLFVARREDGKNKQRGEEKRVYRVRGKELIRMDVKSWRISDGDVSIVERVDRQGIELNFPLFLFLIVCRCDK